jgi:hypothetical protein
MFDQQVAKFIFVLSQIRQFFFAEKFSKNIYFIIGKLENASLKKPPQTFSTLLATHNHQQQAAAVLMADPSSAAHIQGSIL